MPSPPSRIGAPHPHYGRDAAMWFVAANLCPLRDLVMRRDRTDGEIARLARARTRFRRRQRHRPVIVGSLDDPVSSGSLAHNYSRNWPGAKLARGFALLNACGHRTRGRRSYYAAVSWCHERHKWQNCSTELKARGGPGQMFGQWDE